MHFVYHRSQRARPIYTKEEEAVTLLTRCKAQIERQSIVLVDYLLLPRSLELLLACRHSFSTQGLVHPDLLLSIFAQLGRMGSQWPYCGFHELFFKSHCFAELGKSGFVPPLPLKEIIDAKRKGSTKAIRADEIA